MTRRGRHTLAGFFVTPRLIRSYVPRYVQEQLQRRANVGEVRREEHV